MAVKQSNKSYKRHSKIDADEKQLEICKKFPQESFLGNSENCSHFMQWITFFRRNMHRFAMDYLGIKLHLYQIIILYFMGICRFCVIIASRASAKSWIIALYACCYCILYPHSTVVLCSGTKGQSKLLISDKIEGFMQVSAPLRKEIKKVISNQNDMAVYFKDGSVIKVVPASENARGNRSNVCVREEARQIKKFIDDSILSPFQVLRQPEFSVDPYYSNIEGVKQKSTDIYISSSWFDNGGEGSWIWKIVDSCFESMMADKPMYVFALDESIALKHGIKDLEYFQTEKKKQDPITWKLEFLNYRLKESTSAFFTYELLQKNQVYKKPFYPRRTIDFLSGKKNPYSIPKVAGEIRIVCADFAFVEGQANDNSAFTCMRLLPESVSIKDNVSNEIRYDNGYRRIVCYIETMKGQELRKQAIRTHELFDDFEADYICIDGKNGGVGIYDLLARTLYDDDRGVEMKALCAMNNESFANRIRVDGAEPRIYVISATPQLNSDIALDFRRVLSEGKIEFLMNFEYASENILPKIKEYITAPDAETSFFYERPFLETQALFAETSGLLYEKKDSGIIRVHEQGANTKDRYSSCSYASWMASQLERDLVGNSDEYEFVTFIN